MEIWINLKKLTEFENFQKSNILQTIGKNLMWHYLDAITVIFFSIIKNFKSEFFEQLGYTSNYKIDFIWNKKLLEQFFEHHFQLNSEIFDF